MQICFEWSPTGSHIGGDLGREPKLNEGVAFPGGIPTEEVEDQGNGANNHKRW